jgi:hypothetical protein
MDLRFAADFVGFAIDDQRSAVSWATLAAAATGRWDCRQLDVVAPSGQVVEGGGT